MAFEVLNNKKPLATGKVDIATGARMVTRKLQRNGRLTEFVQVTVGAKAATALSLTKEKHGLAVMFGTGEDRGKLAFTVDNEKGQFIVKRNMKGEYLFTLSGETIEGRLRKDFGKIEREKIEIVKISPERPVYGVMDISDALVAGS